MYHSDLDWTPTSKLCRTSHTQTTSSLQHEEGFTSSKDVFRFLVLFFFAVAQGCDSEFEVIWMPITLHTNLRKEARVRNVVMTKDGFTGLQQKSSRKHRVTHNRAMSCPI